MNPKHARRLIEDGEDQQVEFKTTFAEANEAVESLAAFANADGGTVFFGVTDEGALAGVLLGRKTIEDFANRLQQNTEPRLTPRIRKMRLGENVVVVAATVDAVSPDNVVHAFGRAKIRVGKSNVLMPPEQQKERYFRGFKAEIRSRPDDAVARLADESWQQRERRRIETYEHHRGLFLVHAWKPSSEQGQVADIVIFLRQHLDGPLTQGLIKSVEYHLGPRFGDRTVVETNGENGFRLEVSAYGPFLCLARVSFDDGSPSLDLHRYIDF